MRYRVKEKVKCFIPKIPYNQQLYAAVVMIRAHDEANTSIHYSLISFTIPIMKRLIVVRNMN